MSKKILIQLLSMVILFQCGCIVTAHTRSILSSHNESKFVDDGISDTRSLPPLGKGYRTYSYLGSALGRQYAHSLVIKTLEETFSNLYEETGRTFDIAEIGHREGGTFQPHKTHQNGLSVDIMTPMMVDGNPSRLSTGPLSLWGYCWHINPDNNQLNGYGWDVSSTSTYPKLCPKISVESEKEVDFEMLKMLIQELSRVAKLNGGSVRYVIVAPSFVLPLKGVGKPLSTKSKIVHDDHIHVEFSF